MQVRPVPGLGKQRPCPEHVTLSLQNIVRMGPYHSAEHLQVRISANGDPGSGSKPLISVHWPCPLQALLRPLFGMPSQPLHVELSPAHTCQFKRHN
jgi:hypothetical protein